MKKWVKKILIGFACLLGIVLLANLGLNIWLKTQLPHYIKNNTDYKVSYKTLEVDLISGNILSSGITVNSKNPKNIKVIGLQGTVDSLKISRFGIYDALFNKQISSSDLVLVKPHLNIILAQPANAKTGKKKNPVLLENIEIKDGSVAVFKYTKQKFVSVRKLNLSVKNLQLTDQSAGNKLPVVFDSYRIEGEDFFFRPDISSALTIHSIKTTNGNMVVEQFRWLPLLTLDQFKRFYPEKSEFFQVEIPKMEFKNMALKKNKISLAHADFQNPSFSVYTTNAPKKKKASKPLEIELNLEDFTLHHATVKVLKPDGKNLLNAKELNLTINRLHFDKETREQIIPVGYKSFQFSGKDILYSNHQDFSVESLAFNPKGGELRNISAIPGSAHPEKMMMNLKTGLLAFHLNKLEFVNKKLNLDIKDILVDHLDGTIKAGISKIKKTPKENKINSIVVRKFSLKNSNIVYDKGNQPLAFKELNATVNTIDIQPKSNNFGHLVHVKDYFLTTRNLMYKTKFYAMSIGLLKLNKNKVQMDQFAMKPLVSRTQFIRMIPVEKDLYDLKARQITADGNWDLFSQNKFINANHVVIQSADANIFRSKIPNDDPKEKPLYSRLLRSIKIPLWVNNLDLKNSILVYEEDTPKSAGPGKLTFSHFNMNVRNLNSAKTKGKPTRVDIKIDCSFMDQGPLSVNWNFDVANTNDVFSISGRAANLPAAEINPFIRPYLHVTATGTIQEMLFNFKGNPKGLNGTFNLKHKDLKVTILDKDNKEKKGLLTAVANLLVKSDSGNLPQSVAVEDVERDPTKSFFNLFWKGIEQGLKKTLIGIDVDKTKKKVDNAVAAVKDMKESVKEVKEEIKTHKEQPASQPAEKEKKGFLKGVFRKKEKSETE